MNIPQMYISKIHLPRNYFACVLTKAEHVKYEAGQFTFLPTDTNLIMFVPVC